MMEGTFNAPGVGTIDGIATYGGERNGIVLADGGIGRRNGGASGSFYNDWDGVLDGVVAEFAFDDGIDSIRSSRIGVVDKDIDGRQHVVADGGGRISRAESPLVGDIVGLVGCRKRDGFSGASKYGICNYGRRPERVNSMNVSVGDAPCLLVDLEDLDIADLIAESDGNGVGLDGVGATDWGPSEIVHGAGGGRPKADAAIGTGFVSAIRDGWGWRTRLDDDRKVGVATVAGMSGDDGETASVGEHILERCRLLVSDLVALGIEDRPKDIATMRGSVGARRSDAHDIVGGVDGEFF